MESNLPQIRNPCYRGSAVYPFQISLMSAFCCHFRYFSVMYGWRSASPSMLSVCASDQHELQLQVTVWNQWRNPQKIACPPANPARHEGEYCLQNTLLDCKICSFNSIDFVDYCLIGYDTQCFGQMCWFQHTGRSWPEDSGSKCHRNVISSSTM
jgi:hypothetical protein